MVITSVWSGLSAVGFPGPRGGYLPALDSYNTGTDDYVDLVVAAKRELTIPVIASLNGTSEGGWTHYGATLEAAGADALELNVYYVAADIDASALDVEDRYLRLVERLRGEIDIPLTVKIGPYFSGSSHRSGE